MMTKIKQWLCKLHVIALNLFPGQSSTLTASFSNVIACDVFDLMLCFTLLIPFAGLSAEKQVIVKGSISLFFVFLSFA